MRDWRILDLANPGDVDNYKGLLETFPISDPQHTAEFVRTAALAENGSTYALWCCRDTEALLYPFVLRDLRNLDEFRDCLGERPLKDAVTPFEYGGFLAATPKSWLALGEAGRACLDEFFIANGVVSEFLRLNPFISLPEGIDSAYEIRKIHDSVYIDTSQGSDAAVTAAHRSVRKNLRRAQEECGLDFSPVEANATNIGEFIRLYHETMRRAKAKPYYFFSLAYYKTLLEDSAHVALFHVRDPRGRVLAASILVHGHGIAHHFLTGSDEAALPQRPNDLMLIGLTDWCHDRGLTKLHLGGGPPSIRAYKQRFSGCSAPYYIAHRVVDASAYEALVRHRLSASTTSAFRPAYREGL